MKLFRIVAGLLVAATLLLCTACGTRPDKGESDTIHSGLETNAETDNRIQPNIPMEKDYQEEVINFLCWYLPDWAEKVCTYRDITSKGPNGDIVNDAVFNRNALIKERYNVEINMLLKMHNEVPSTIINQVESGTNDWDVAYPRLLNVGGLITAGMFLNLYDVDYIDLEKPWWDQSSVSDLTFMNQLYTVSAGLNVNDKDATAAVAFNKKACTDRGMDYFYGDVENGSWTIERILEICDEIGSPDMNGNGNGVDDMEDFWAFLGKHDVSTAFFAGSGSRIIGRDESGSMTFSAGTEQAVDAVDLIGELMNSEWFFNHHLFNIGSGDYIKMFENGQGLFFWLRLEDVTNMRSSETEFGILPTPKATEDQDGYYSVVSPHVCGCMSIPASLNDERLEMVGLILEALSAESYYTLQPAYIEQSLKTKYSSDQDSAAMMDIIFQRRVFDPGIVFGIGSFANVIQNIGSKHGSLTTEVASGQGTMEKAIEAFMLIYQQNQ